MFHTRGPDRQQRNSCRKRCCVYVGRHVSCRLLMEEGAGRCRRQGRHYQPNMPVPNPTPTGAPGVRSCDSSPDRQPVTGAAQVHTTATRLFKSFRDFILKTRFLHSGGPHLNCVFYLRFSRIVVYQTFICAKLSSRKSDFQQNSERCVSENR